MKIFLFQNAGFAEFEIEFDQEYNLEAYVYYRYHGYYITITLFWIPDPQATRHNVLNVEAYMGPHMTFAVLLYHV